MISQAPTAKAATSARASVVRSTFTSNLARPAQLAPALFRVESTDIPEGAMMITSDALEARGYTVDEDGASRLAYDLVTGDTQ